MSMEELYEAVKKRFGHLSTKQLIRKMERAPDFGYDDEEVELERRGVDWRWKDNRTVEVLENRETTE